MIGDLLDRTSTKRLALIDEPSYGDWTLGSEHPTKGVRHLIGNHVLRARALAADVDVLDIRCRIEGVRKAIECVHTKDYVSQVIDQGITNEWPGSRPELGGLAAKIVGGSLAALDALLAGEAAIAVNLAGAKHHAHRDHSSGFCVFNDFAVAAIEAIERGQRVAVLDWDAHHGDGTEVLLKDIPEALTFSIHQEGIFPGTGLVNFPNRNVYNRPLRAGSSGSITLMHQVMEFANLAKQFGATIIFLAAGADGHRRDPLSDLRFTTVDFGRAARYLRSLVGELPILMGGAGGYCPRDITPEVWAEVAVSLATGDRYHHRGATLR